MEAIYATLIICIFAVWVWDLKHQVSDLRGLVLPEDAQGIEGTAAHGRNHASHQKAERRPRLVEQPARLGRPMRKDDGVATWVID